jgi:hypothetical protein
MEGLEDSDGLIEGLSLNDWDNEIDGETDTLSEELVLLDSDKETEALMDLLVLDEGETLPEGLLLIDLEILADGLKLPEGLEDILGLWELLWEELTLRDSERLVEALGLKDAEILELWVADGLGLKELLTEAELDKLSDKLTLLLGETLLDKLAETDTDVELLGLIEGDTLGLLEVEILWDTLLDTLALTLALGETLWLILGLTDTEVLELGEPKDGFIPNTTPVEPAFAVAPDAHVLTGMKVPSESPDVTAIEQSLPVAVSRSMTFVQSGLASLDIDAAKVVRSLP